MVKLTKSVVDGAQPRDKRYVIFDEKITGFGLRVYPSGQKVWILEYRNNGGGRKIGKKRYTIGSVKDFTADEARKEADILRSRVKVGDDPQAKKIDKRNALTVEELCTLYLNNHVEQKRKANTIGSYRDIVRLHIAPAFGKTKANEIKISDVERLHLKMAKTPSAANKTLALLHAVFGYGFKMKLIEKRDNPASGIEKFSEKPKERFLSKDELSRLGEALAEAETVGVPWDTNPEKLSKHLRKGDQRTTIDIFAAAAIRLLILTGARLREILHLRWDQVDLDRGILMLSDSKTGPGNIVLGEAALDVIRGLNKIGVYVIASESAGEPDEKPRADLKRPWSKIRKYADIHDVRLHDLRHTFASIGVNNGESIAVVARLLRHRNISTTMRYAHLEVDSLRKATDIIGYSVKGKS